MNALTYFFSISLYLMLCRGDWMDPTSVGRQSTEMPWWLWALWKMRDLQAQGIPTRPGLALASSGCGHIETYLHVLCTDLMWAQLNKSCIFILSVNTLLKSPWPCEAKLPAITLQKRRPLTFKMTSQPSMLIGTQKLLLRFLPNSTLVRILLVVYL